MWWIETLVWRIATLGRSFLIYKTMRFGQRTAGLPSFTTPSDFVSRATAEWNLALQHTSKEWKMSCSGCALIAPLSMSMLQINSVFNDVLARTSTIAAFVFAVAGLVLSASLVLNLHQLNRRKCRNQWINASRSFGDLESIEFWSLLAFPMSLLMWSVIFFLITVLVLAWNIQDGSLLSDSISGGKRAQSIISATFLMLLAMTLAALCIAANRLVGGCFRRRAEKAPVNSLLFLEFCKFCFVNLIYL
ncbi:hypothetical protein BJ912DRAFT_1042072 [Pholiota molesta]|nr:hypothetical protein BJ912DRAFT_1042072 [Pholiota molesta]